MTKRAANSVKKKNPQGATKVDKGRKKNYQKGPAKGPKAGFKKGKSNGSHSAKKVKAKEGPAERLAKITDQEQLLKMVPSAKGPLRSLLFKQIRHVKKAAKSKLRRERRDAENAGETVERAVPVTIEMMRETDDTYVEGDAEVAQANQADEFSDYFAGKTIPKLFITTGNVPLSPKMEIFLKEFTAIIPNCVYYERMKFRMKSIVESAQKHGFTDILVFIEKKKIPYGVYIIHLPNGPSTFFRLSGLTLAQDITDLDTAASTNHLPEIITKNFSTRCGERISRQFLSLFPLKPEYLGRRLIVFHNQRDFIFFRHYRYVFTEDGEKAKLQEIGPRFTLKLRVIQEGTFDFKEGSSFLMAITPYEWSTSVAYGVFYAAILCLASVAILWSHLQSKIKLKHPNEDLVSARNTQRWWSIAASFFSSAMGSWVLTLPAEIGSKYGWWGVLGYSLATALPWAFLAIFGPKLRRITSARGFTAVDFLKTRLGLPLHFIFLLIQLGVVFLAFIAEAITIGGLFQIVAPGVKPVVITVSMAIIVYLYTFFAGIRATLLTDRIQFCVLSALIIVGISAILAEVNPKIQAAGGSSKGSWSMEGFLAFWILNLSCFFPTFMDPSSWSRMYAAKTEHDGRIGLLAAAGLLLIPMTIFGSVGIVGQAAIDSGVLDPLDESESVFFKLLTIVKPGWSLLVLIMATCLSASTIDTLASGISTLIAAGIDRHGLNYNWARLASFVIFIIALIVAIFQSQTVLTLFMVGNLIATFVRFIYVPKYPQLSCTWQTTPILLLSLWDFVTPKSCAAGILSGAIIINILGACFGFGWSAGFEWWLKCGTDFSPQVLGTFITSGATSTLVAIIVAQIQFRVNPQKREDEKLKFEKISSNMATEKDESNCNGKSPSFLSGHEGQSFKTSLSHHDLPQASFKGQIDYAV